MAVQRLRVKYGRTGDLQYVAHLDLMRMWIRVFRRAGIPFAYSGKHAPRPRLSIGAALPIAVTSEGELLDVFLRRRLSPFYFLQKVEPQLPQGLTVSEVSDVPIDAPSLQSLVRQAEYRVRVSVGDDPDRLQREVRKFLAAESVPWEHLREQSLRRYDLRKLVYDLWVEGKANGQATIGMLLKNDPEASGRPEQVVAALGVDNPPDEIHRTRLVLADPPKPRRSRR